MDKKWLPYLLIFVAAVAQYANTKDHDFAWDDAIVLTENSRVQKGWSDIPELFENIKTAKTENRYGYRPISLFSFATDVEFFGLNAKASHKISIIFYGLLCLLIFQFLQSVFPNRTWQNFLITLLFVVHPLHTEVVANIKSRDEVLAMGFGLISMLYFLRALKNASVLSYLGFAIFLVLAFLSKENAVVFCGVALLLFWYQMPKIDKNQQVKHAGIILGSFLLLLAIRLFVYSSLFFQNEDFELGEKGLFLQDGFVGNPLVLVASEFLLKWLNIIQIALFHIYKFIVPYPLVHDYGYNSLEVILNPNIWNYLAVVTFVVLLLITVKAIKDRSTVGFGLAFFFITASVYLHVAQLAPDIFGERFVFVSSLGLCIAAVDGSYALLKNPKLKFGAFGFWMLISVLFFAISFNRNMAWKDNETLLKTDLVNLPNGARINYNMALYLHRIYYDLPVAQKPAMQDSILHYYERTMQITDRLFPAYIDLGAAYMEFKKPEKARQIFQKTIDNYPELSAPYVQMAKYHMTNADYGAAVPLLEMAIEKGSKNSDYYYLLAICCFNAEQQSKAISILLEGEKLAVSSSAYHLLLARLYTAVGDKDNAIDAINRGLILYPQDLALKQNLQSLLGEKQ